MAKKKSAEKWFEAGKPLNWHKGDSQTARRRNALKARKGNLLTTAKALMALSNVTTDPETKRKARAESLYFYARNKRLNKGQKK